MTAQTEKGRHTPGPWHHERLLVGDEWQIVASEHDPIGYAPNVAVGIYAEADARLIAAAPQLLEALKELLWHATDYAGSTASMWTGEQLRDAMLQARAAIKMVEEE